MSTADDDPAPDFGAFVRELADPTRYAEPFRLEIRDLVDSGVEWRIVDANGTELRTGRSRNERDAREVARKFKAWHEDRVRQWKHDNRPREWRDYPL